MGPRSGKRFIRSNPTSCRKQVAVSMFQPRQTGDLPAVILLEKVAFPSKESFFLDSNKNVLL
jgi:hypothetical protein